MSRLPIAVTGAGLIGKTHIDPSRMERTAVHTGCPYSEQLRHFAALVEGREAPACSALDGFRTLEATLAVTEAAGSGRAVRLGA